MKKRIIQIYIYIMGVSMLLSCTRTPWYCFVQNGEGYDIVVEDRIIGGVNKYNRNPQEIYIGNIIIDAGIFDFDTTKVDFYMIESSLYGDWLLSYGTIEKEIHHELFLYESHLYSVWFNLTEISSEEKTAIMELFMEEIYPHLDR